MAEGSAPLAREGGRFGRRRGAAAHARGALSCIGKQIEETPSIIDTFLSIRHIDGGELRRVHRLQVAHVRHPERGRVGVQILSNRAGRCGREDRIAAELRERGAELVECTQRADVVDDSRDTAR
eukprot:scaffold133672_cov28-Tisochrysis_lutea.AAC.1